MEALTDIGILRLTITSVIQTQQLKFAYNIKKISQVSQKISKVSKSEKSIQLPLNISKSVTRRGFTLPLIKATTLSCQLFVAQYQLHKSYNFLVKKNSSINGIVSRACLQEKNPAFSKKIKNHCTTLTLKLTKELQLHANLE